MNDAQSPKTTVFEIVVRQTGFKQPQAYKSVSNPISKSSSLFVIEDWF